MSNEEDVSKYFIGTHEVQECLEGQCELDLHTHLANCKKNPGHSEFVPINKLTAQHFPSDYHNEDLLDFTQAVADLTVRIAVNFTSLDRPEFVPGTTDPYPCYNKRGNSSLRTGTGRVRNVEKYTEGKRGYTSCPCPECTHSDTPSKVWWHVGVVTAKHVVFDSSEAEQSSCRLWFDDEVSPVVKIYGWQAGWSSNERDWCVFYCATHDSGLAGKLEEMLQRFSFLCGKISEKHKGLYLFNLFNNCNNSRHLKDVDKLTIIVSHPHGCSKQVSIGHWVHKQEVSDERTRYAYTTCTCPGSSGAQVYRLGCNWLCAHAHSGGNSDGLNYSGLEWG